MFLLYGLWFLIAGFWFRVSGFGAALICGFNFHCRKCVHSCVVSGYVFLLSFSSWCHGLWLDVFGFWLRMSGFGAARACGFVFRVQ